MNLDELEKFINRPNYQAYPEWIRKRCPYHVKFYDDILILEVEEFVEGSWSAFYTGEYCQREAFFILETDAMAFKLRWT